jgi:hypothetical protein
MFSSRAMALNPLPPCTSSCGIRGELYHFSSLQNEFVLNSTTIRSVTLVSPAARSRHASAHGPRLLPASLPLSLHPPGQGPYPLRPRQHKKTRASSGWLARLSLNSETGRRGWAPCFLTLTTLAEAKNLPQDLPLSFRPGSEIHMLAPTPWKVS